MGGWGNLQNICAVQSAQSRNSHKLQIRQLELKWDIIELSLILFCACIWRQFKAPKLAQDAMSAHLQLSDFANLAALLTQWTSMDGHSEWTQRMEQEICLNVT